MNGVTVPPSVIERVVAGRGTGHGGFDTVLITGTVTNVCCESSVRDAMTSNFRVIMVSNGNAANTPEDHVASLTAFYLTFGDVMDTDMLVGRLPGTMAAAA